jgi:hypothetical protein
VGARGSTGHASAAMTLDTYADLFDDDLDAVSSAVDDASRAAAVPQPKSRKAPAGSGYARARVPGLSEA